MRQSADRLSHLPKRFPVGATYVVEARGGKRGDLRIFSRYVVLPGGRRINVLTDLNRPAAPRALARRPRADRLQSRVKNRSATPRKKISRRAGTG